MVKKALFVLLTSSFTQGEQLCGTTADCDDGDLCNFDDGASGGFCEPCPGETDQDCIDSGYITDLGTAECQSVCVVEQSEFIKVFSLNELVTSCLRSLPFRPVLHVVPIVKRTFWNLATEHVFMCIGGPALECVIWSDHLV